MNVIVILLKYDLGIIKTSNNKPLKIYSNNSVNLNTNIYLYHTDDNKVSHINIIEIKVCRKKRT